MKPFCLLSNPDTYKPLDWDLVEDIQGCAAWLAVFEKVFSEILGHANRVYGEAAATRINTARRQFAAEIATLRSNPASFQTATGKQLNLLELDRIRDCVLRSNGLPDPFSAIKTRENRAAMALYTLVVDLHDYLEGRNRWLHLVEGVIAGNTFDLGAPATFHLGHEPQDFMACIENTKPRPWFKDDFDAFADCVVSESGPRWHKAVILVDNAGSDFVLGVLPFARELLKCGVKVVLGANELPSLNDITATEVREVVSSLRLGDPLLDNALTNDMLSIVSTGTDVPVIDLSAVSDELNAAAADADLLVLEGMGRGVETNYDADFTIDTLRICLIKNESVAQRIGGENFDCVCRFTNPFSPT
jgi:damage-control phosphatase, subfamily II, stand-alone protein